MPDSREADRPLLIAELCQNHGGDRALLIDMVQAAADSGADYVKIQGLYSADLSLRERFEAGLADADGRQLVMRRPYPAERQRLAGLDLSPQQELDFVQACVDAGVRPLITVFTRTAVSRLASYGFPAVKIASADCASLPLLREVAEHWDRLFLSTGAMFLSEVERALGVLSGRDVTLLHCVMQYPTPWHAARLARMESLRKLTPAVGLSDHSAPAVDELWASKLALALGAAAIERHFTVLGPTDTKDGPVSITPDQLRELRDFSALKPERQLATVREHRPDWQQAIAWPDPDPSAEELFNRDYYAGRVANWVGGRQVFNWEDLELPVVSRLPELPDPRTG